MSVKRSTINMGGGLITYRSVTIYSEGDITVTINSKSAPLKVAMIGKLTDSYDDVSVEIDFTPSGEVTASLIEQFLPFFDNTVWYPGRSIFDPNTDYPLVINSRDGRVFTTVNAACMNPASLIGAGTKTLFGATKFVGLRQNGVSRSVAGSLFTTGTASYPGDANFNGANIFRTPFMGRWLADRAGTITGTSNANPDVITTSADHGLIPGDQVTIVGALGDTAINGTFTVAPTSLTETTFTLYILGTTTPVAGTGAWTSGGTFTRYGVVPGGTITGASNANPSVIATAADHGLLAGDTVTIAGALGNTAINGTFTVAPTDLAEETFTLYVQGTTTPVAGSGAWTSGGTFTRANVGDSFAAFTTEGGFEIKPGVKLTPVKIDDEGVIDMVFDEADVKVTCTPVGPTLNDFLAATMAQGPGAIRGGDAGASGKPLYLTAAGVYIKVPLAAVVDPANTLYSPSKKRLGKVTWNSEATFVNNQPQSLLQVSVTPIP